MVLLSRFDAFFFFSDISCCLILKLSSLSVQAAATRSLARGTNFNAIISMLKEVSLCNSFPVINYYCQKLIAGTSTVIINFPSQTIYYSFHLLSSLIDKLAVQIPKVVNLN